MSVKNSLPDGFKQTEVGMIPEDWDVAALESVCQKSKQTTPKPDSEFEYIDVSSISNELFKITGSTRYKGSDAPSRARKLIQKDDVLFATVRPTLKRIALVPLQYDQQVCSTAFCVVRANQNLAAPAFLFHSLLTDELNDRIAQLQRGANYPAVTDSNVLNQIVPLPPLPEQRAIAHVLSKIQSAAETQTKIAERARELKRALMAKLFIEGLRGEPLKETEIGIMPEGWEVIKLGERVAVQSGGTPSRSNPSYWGGKIAWVKTGEINYKVITDTEEKITEAGLANSSARLVPAGTLLMAMYGQGVTRGRVAILGIEATTNQACAALVPNETLTTDYLYVYLSFAYERVRNLGHGAQQTNLSGEIIKTIKLPVPSLDEQKEIVRIMQTVDAKIEAAERKRAGLDELFRAMLGQLMTGRVRTTGLMKQHLV